MVYFIYERKTIIVKAIYDVRHDIRRSIKTSHVQAVFFRVRKGSLSQVDPVIHQGVFHTRD